jgi:integrase
MLKVLTEVQVDALLAAPDWRTRLGKRDRAFLHILALGGLRISEACNLRMDELEWEGDSLRLTFAGKGGYVRTVSLPERAVKALKMHIVGQTSAFVFPGRGEALSARAAHSIVVSAAQKAGLPDWVHPHSLRHTYGTLLMRKTGDLFLVSRVLGHRNMQTTTQYYLAYDRTYADRAAEAIQ